MVINEDSVLIGDRLYNTLYGWATVLSVTSLNAIVELDANKGSKTFIVDNPVLWNWSPPKIVRPRKSGEKTYAKIMESFESIYKESKTWQT